MALSFDTNSRDQVCLRVAGRLYANCDTEIQTNVGGTNGAGARALTQIQRWAHFLEMGGSDVAPDAWLFWLVDLASYEASLAEKPNEAANYRRKAMESMRDALASFTRSEIDGTTPADLGLTTAKLRRYVVSRCVRRRPALYPEPDVIDTAIESTLIRVWNDADWRFTQVEALLTINTDSTVTMTDTASSSITPDRLMGNEIYLTAGKGRICSVDRDVILRDRAQTSPTAGQPVYFHMYKSAGGIVWMFSPKPDQAYSGTAMIQLQQPAMTTSAQIDTALALFPPEFTSIIRELVLAHVLRDLGVPDSTFVERKALDDLTSLAPVYDSPGGEPERSVEGRVRRRGLGAMPRFLGGGV